jgi:site-specific recombinase XerD
MIEWYRQTIIPALGGDPNGDLFINPGGGSGTRDALTDKIVKAIKRRLGIQMSPHQFRHLAAKLYLDQHPEDFETVRALLGHAWSKTTQMYVGLSSGRAGQTYAKMMVEQRRKLKDQPKRRRRPRQPLS